MTGDVGFDGMWAELLPVGRDGRSGGYRRFAYDDAELACREWFVGTAQARGLDVTTDRNGNLWAWWGDPGRDGPGIVTGSHLDSVSDGGAYDGPLGIVSAFAAIDHMRATGLVPDRPIGIVAFADEEGGRFGIACAGSRLAVGQLDPDQARGLRDHDATTMAEAMQRAGHDPAGLGRDDETLARVGAYVELHVEQGRGLVEHSAPVGVASSIWPHGRWRFDFRGEANHAGTTLMADRRDPMLTYAMTALAANKQARLADARATFGRVSVTPNGTNAVPSHVAAWLDARAADQDTLDAVVIGTHRQAVDRAERDGTTVSITPESISPRVDFDEALRRVVATAVERAIRGSEDEAAVVPVLPTGAGHDAGILSAAGIPAAMIFVRNPTGVSHAPSEFAEEADCHVGVHALAAVLAELTTPKPR